MCGIAGKINFDGPVDGALLQRMCYAMRHRGPSSRGTYVADGVAIGMQRLAIIDIAGGDQPMFNEDRSIAVVMNGEIYNFQTLRAELVGRGHTFLSHADTEVLVHLYEEMGERMVDRLRGMFAFAIWDSRRRELLLGRDRVGKKPLFWSRRGSTVWFASELMAMLQDPEVERTPNQYAIANYLTFQYVPDPLCAFTGIEKLPPATTLRITADGQTASEYWALDYERKLDDTPEPELEERLRELLWESTRLRLISEVPLGAFLSGGIDSSAVVAAMADQMSEPVKTFSIGFGAQDFDELRYARMVAERFSTDHHEFQVEPEAMSIIPKLARHYGEPYADPSAIPSFYLAELTGRHVTVALNGDGGDESFGGYRRYVGSSLPAHLDWLPRPLRRLVPHVVRPLGEGERLNSNRTRIQRLARTIAMDDRDRYAHWMSPFYATMHGRVFTPEFARSLGDWRANSLLTDRWGASAATARIDQMLDVDVHTYLPGDLLVKVDIATMAYSVEARSPFLDHHMMEFAASLPAHLKLQGMQGKRILKSALRGVIPTAILDRPKMGFGVPLMHWFRDELRDLPADVLLDPGAHSNAYIRREAVEKMIREHQAAAADHSLRLWVLLQLEYWHREVVESPLLEDLDAVAVGSSSD
jgi:asparagine synthase (glutamine-hydrolysing)